MDKNNYNGNHSDSPEDKKLDSFLNSLSTAEIDTSRIKQLTWMKIKEEKRKQKHRMIIACSSVACIICIVSIFSIYTFKSDLNSENESVVALAENESNNFIEINVPVGKQITIKLSDGTIVKANSRTKVVYPKTFSGKTRNIYTKGEAYLEVAHDKKHPFIVESDQFRLKVLGTKFNINNYNQDNTKIVLVQGSVEVTTHKKEIVRMRPNELLRINKEGTMPLKTINTKDYICWTDGIIIMNGEKLSQLGTRLSDFYGKEIVCDKATENIRIYGKLELKQNEKELLHVLTTIVPIKVENIDGKVMLKRQI